MKLKCEAHDRRVLVLNSKFAHRTGDMSKCDSKTAAIGPRKYEIVGDKITQTIGDLKVDLNPDPAPAVKNGKVTQIAGAEQVDLNRDDWAGEMLHLAIYGKLKTDD